jgi:large subunit ribosomal protein L18
MKGIVDSGVSMPVSEESLPEQERISGQHIAEYAGTLKENPEEYNSRFSAILKNGLSPEDYPSHFEEIKSRLSGGKPAEKPAAPKKAEKEEEAPAPTPKEKKKEAPAKEEKKAPKEKKEPKKKEAKEEKGKEKKKAKGGKSKKK